MKWPVLHFGMEVGRAYAAGGGCVRRLVCGGRFPPVPPGNADYLAVSMSWRQVAEICLSRQFVLLTIGLHFLFWPIATDRFLHLLKPFRWRFRKCAAAGANICTVADLQTSRFGNIEARFDCLLYSVLHMIPREYGMVGRGRNGQVKVYPSWKEWHFRCVDRFRQLHAGLAPRP